MGEPFGFILCSFSDGGIYRINVGGRLYHFDFSERFGPTVVGGRGQEVKQPGHKNDFWRAVSLWANQGKRKDDTGMCVWTEPKPPVVKRLSKSSYFLVEPGDDDWDELGSLPMVEFDNDTNG